MKVFTLHGVSNSGKTTTAEFLIRELCSRGYSVASVKNIHYEGFALDRKGTDTQRHKAAGAAAVTARALEETDLLFTGTLPMDKILSFYNEDFVLLEGNSELSAPKIITAAEPGEIEERMNSLVIAVSGKISQRLSEYKGIPVIDARTDSCRLVDLLETIPDYSPLEKTISLSVGGKEIPLNKFVEPTLADTIKGFLRNLKGYQEGADVVIKLKGGSN